MSAQHEADETAGGCAEAEMLGETLKRWKEHSTGAGEPKERRARK
jgi:hypothetical protein